MSPRSGPFPERLWIALFVLLPLAYNPVSRWQYEPDKVALTLAFTASLLGWSLWRGTLPRLAGCRAEWWIGGYLLIRLLTTARSIAPHWSLWGDPAWRNGLWLTLACAVLFGLARRQLTTPQRRARAVTAILIGSAVVAGYGVLQYAGLDPLTTQDLVRVPSTLAHPNLLAAYLAMVMPLTATRLFSSSHRAWAGALLALQAVCLVFTYSRAGWLAAITGLAVLGIAALWTSGRRRAAGLLSFGGAMGLVTLFALSLLPPLPGSAPHALQTLTSMFRWQGATAQIRLLGWQASLNAIRERPWLGYGPATFRVVMEWFVPPQLAPFGGAPALGGRPHNVFLEVAIESGLIGLACYLVMIGAILFSRCSPRSPDRGAVGDRIQRGATRQLQAAILGALAANLVTHLFSFESATTAVLFWSLAGIAHARPVPEQATMLRRPRLALIVTVGSALLAAWMVVPDVLAFVGESLAENEMWRESTNTLELASDLAPTPEVFRLSQGNAYAAWAIESQDETIWQRGADVYARLVGQRPDVAAYWQARGLYLRRWSLASERADAARQAVDSYTEALRLSPDDPDLWLDRGLAWLQAGDPDSALADLQQAGFLLSDYSRYYGAMSVYALAQGDPAAAAAWQERALEAQQEWDAWAWRR